MTRVIIRQSAKNDLEFINQYIRRRNPSRAASFVLELKQMCLSLNEFPERYPIEPDAGHNIHKMAYKGYLIFYRYEKENDSVYILGVLEEHQRY